MPETTNYENKLEALETELRKKKLDLQSTLTTVSALYQVSSTLSLITGKREAYDAFLQEVGKLLGAEIGVIYALEDKEFKAVATYGLKHEEERNIVGKIKGSWLEKIIKNNKPERFYDKKGKATDLIGVETDYPINASLVAPIETSKGIEAVVHFSRLYDEEFTFDDERVLRILTSKLSLVLKNIGISKQLQENLSLLQTTLESTADGIVAVTLMGEITQSNSRFAQMWKVPPEFKANEEIFNFLTTQLTDPDKLFFNNKRLAADAPTELSVVLTLKDGRVFDQYAHPQILGGKLVGWVLSYRDVTERMKEKKVVEEQVEIRTSELQAERAKLLASNRLMTGLLDNLPVGVFVVDASGKPIIVNKTAGKLSGRSAEEMVSNTPRSYSQEYTLTREDGTIYPEDELPLMVTFKKHIPAAKRDIFISRGDGSRIPIMVLSSPVFDAVGNLELVIMVYQDITDEYYIDRAKTEFVSLASHQLRTPLSAMNWYAEMLTRGYAGKLDHTQTDFVEEIYKSSKRMSELVSTLLNVSRIELGTFSIEPIEYDLCKIIDTVFDELKLQVSQKHITMDIEADKRPFIVSIDVKLMDIVIENLLTNAVKYTADGGKISVSLSREKNGSATIAVKDTGYGIPAGEQNKIFTKMYRAENIKIMDTYGTGLGLYMVKAILDSSGCAIRFTSVEKKGTTFFVEIPPQGMKKKEGRKHLTGFLS